MKLVVRVCSILLSVMTVGAYSSARANTYSGGGINISQNLDAPALAIPNSLTIVNKHLIPNAVTISITPRGQQYFQTNLQKILGNIGLNLQEGYFDAFEYKSDQNVNLDDLAKSSPETADLIKSLRSLLTTWFMGFSLKDHRPAVAVGDSGYTAVFNRFSLVTDQALMNQLHLTDGAVLAVELEVKGATLASEYVKAYDQNNQFLGDVTFEKPAVSIDAKSPPLKIRLPFYVRVQANGELEFKALETVTNIKDLILDFSYKKLVTPQIAIEINGKKYSLSQDQLEKQLRSELPTILGYLQDYLHKFATEQLPNLLNEKARAYLKGQLEQVNYMAPPGGDKSGTDQAFLWGLGLENIKLDNSLQISLSGYAEDPLNPYSPLGNNILSRGTPTLIGSVNPSDYDVAMSIDRGLINRILQLSFERRLFEKIAIGDGTFLKLTSSPKVDSTAKTLGFTLKNQKEAFVKIRASIEQQPDSWWLRNTIVVDIDVLAKIRPMDNKGNLQVVLVAIDPDSLSVDDQYFSGLGSLVKDTVRKGIKDKLNQISAGWASKESVLPGSLPLPPEILGIKLDINRLMMDPRGHLVMFLNYGAQK